MLTHLEKFRNININLATKITIGFALISVLFILISANNYISSQQLTGEIQHIDDQVNPIVKQSTDINSTVLSIEPRVLELLSTNSSAEFDAASNKLNNKIVTLEEQLANIASLTSGNSISGVFNDEINTLNQDLNNSKPLYQELISSQETVISLTIQSDNLAQQISEKTEALAPLFENIFFDLNNEILISMVHEVRASLNKGMFVMEKIKHVNNQEQLDSVKLEFNTWIGNHGNLLPSLIFGSDEEYFQNFVKELADIYNGTIKLLEGDQGLIASQQQIIGILDSQTKTLGQLRTILSDSRQATAEIVSNSFVINTDLVKSIKDKSASQNKTNIILGIIMIVGVCLVSFYIINYFRRSIDHILTELNFLAAGKIRPLQAVNNNDEFGRLNNSLVTVIQSLKKIIVGINESSSHVQESVRKASESAHKSAENMDIQQKELSTVNDKLSEMCVIANDVAGHTEKTYQKVTDAGSLSTKGRERVLASKLSVEKVVTQTQEAIRVIESLDEGVKNIESVMETISNIAEMTNLLALNAAIEAARAGEQGRGFAVVADEVRALANRTQNATAEIQQKTIAMIEESKQAVTVMHRSEKLVTESLNQTQDADKTIAEFDQIMNQVKELSHMIATDSEKQVETVSQLNSNIEKVSCLSETTANQVKDSDKASENQISITKDLESKVMQFTIE